MTYSYDRTQKTALTQGPIGRVLSKRWNDLHDLEYDLKQAAHEYDSAASYSGGAGEREAKQIMAGIEACKKLISQLADSNGAFDKVSEMEGAFIRKHGPPDEYVTEQRNRMFPRAAAEEEKDDPAQKAVKKGQWNLIVRKYSNSRWSYFMQNPQGGGGGSTAYSSMKAAIQAGLRGVDWKKFGKGATKVWLIQAEWGDDSYVVKKTGWLDIPKDLLE